MRGIGSWQLSAENTIVVFLCKFWEEPWETRGVTAVVTCFITLRTFGCHTKPLKTKNEGKGQECSGRHEIFTLTGGCKIYYLKTKINVNYFFLNFSTYRAVNTLAVSVIQTSQLMLYREIIAVCSQIHTKHINTLCGQNVELYIKIQSVPRSKHTPSQLYKPVS